MVSLYRELKKQMMSLGWGSLGNWLIINACIGFFIPMMWSFSDYFSLAGWGRIYDDIIFSIIMSMAISGTVWFIEASLSIALPWFKYPLLRFTLEFVLVSVMAFVAAMVVNFCFFLLLGTSKISDIPWRELMTRSQVPVYIAWVITTFFVSRHFLYSWRQSAVASEQMRAERYKGEVRLLRDQLNPHFLFNSLNVLTNVVYEDPDKAAHFIRELSKFYRYVLEVQDEELVPLQQELTFALRFGGLQQERFGKALQIESEGLETVDGYLPPLVLQLLVENAIKHNALSEERPLLIRITKDGNNLQVWNNCLPRENPQPGTGIGLNNIKERYRLLSARKVELRHSNSEFEVRLPILELKETTSA